MILPILLGGGLLWYLAAARKPKVLGAAGTNSSVSKGPQSGIIYPVAWGEPGPDGRRVHSVFNPDTVLLFTYTQDDAGQNRSLLAQNPQADPDELNVALADFGFGIAGDDDAG